MLKPDQPLAIFMESSLGSRYGKMGEGVMRYSANPIACVIDSRLAGKRVSNVTQIPCDAMIVDSIAAAHDLGAEVLVLGIAPSGGRIPAEWMAPLKQAIDSGMSIVNGLHDRLNEHFPKFKKGQWIWDVRRPVGDPPPIATGLARELDNKRLLMVGTDMAIGKMTAGLEIYRWLRKQKMDVEFLSTGQIGITVTGHGIPLDAFMVDHACGAVERMVMESKDHDILIIEGQGSLLHPGSTATLPLMRGSIPTHLVLCHHAGNDHLGTVPWVKVPPIKDVIELNELVSMAAGAYARPTTIGIALNTRHLNDDNAKLAITQMESETGLPVEDVVRYGAGKLGDALVQA